MEIERKFIAEIIDIPLFWPVDVIEQWYLIDEQYREVRLRFKGNRWFLTEKQGSGMVREETEEEISPFVGKTLSLVFMDKPSVLKRRCYVEGWEIDIYEDNTVVAEIEGKTAEDLDNVKCPKHIRLIQEVTDDPRWKNKSIAKYGIPEHSNKRQFELLKK